MTLNLPGVRIRSFTGIEDDLKCVALQKAVWGDDFSERVPVAILKVSRRLGGVAAGAFDQENGLLGFVFGLTGWEHGRPVHWSDMLAVRQDVRGRGIGTALKLHQRERLVELGVERAYWTFDPLEVRNASLNLGRLGGLAREYAQNMYGRTGSPLHGDSDTDRLVVHWDLRSPRVLDRVERGVQPPGAASMDRAPLALDCVVRDDGCPDPVELDVDEAVSKLRIRVPVDLRAPSARTPDPLPRWRRAVRRALAPRLERGWEVRECIVREHLGEYLVVASRHG